MGLVSVALKPFLPYLIGGGLAIAVVAGGAVWWWHSSTVGKLEKQVASLDKQLSGCKVVKANQTAAYANALTDAARRVNDVYAKALQKRTIKLTERAEKAQRIARNKQREAEAARVNLDVLRRQWDSHGHVCPVPERTPGLLDFAAQATRAGDSIRDDGMPEAPATSPAARQPDDAARRAAEAL